ncbi:MAG: hypothetical protein ABI557_05000 [Aureliella sp.]
MDIWPYLPYLWIACMLGFVIATSVVAIREKKARDAAMQKLKPKSPAAGEAAPLVSAEDGFGQVDPLDGFGESAEVGAFDENAFK